MGYRKWTGFGRILFASLGVRTLPIEREQSLCFTMGVLRECAERVWVVMTPMSLGDKVLCLILKLT